MTSGVLIAENPQNGHILAMVSLPTYNDQIFASGISVADYQKLTTDPGQPLINKAISEQYAPGSTFKLVTALAMAKNGRSTSRTSIPRTIGSQGRQWFADMKAADIWVDSPRHPSVHKSDSTDYIILLSGKITLVLDQEEVDLEPLDVVVQRGTNHAWANRSNKHARVAFVLVDAQPLGIGKPVMGINSAR